MKNVQNIILFMHMPKTGGQTFRKILSTGCRNKHYVHLEHASSKTFTLADIHRILKNCPDTYAIGGHRIFIHPSDFISRQVRYFPIFFVRSWFDQIMSDYYMVRRKKDDPNSSALRKGGYSSIVKITGDVNEYLKFILNGNRPHVFTLFPTRQLKREGKHTQDQIMQYMSMYYIGVVERYDESLVAIEYDLASHFPGIDLSYYRPVDVNPLKNTCKSTYTAERNAADPDVLKRIEKQFSDVIQLYNYANSELDRKICSIPSFEKRLEHFRFRCKINRQLDDLDPSF